MRQNEYRLVVVLGVIAVVVLLFISGQYTINCWQDGGWLFSTDGRGGSLCMTPNGVRWPWDYWGN